MIILNIDAFRQTTVIAVFADELAINSIDRAMVALFCTFYIVDAGSRTAMLYQREDISLCRACVLREIKIASERFHMSTFLIRECGYELAIIAA